MSTSYSVTLWCGCRVYVSRHPESGFTNARVLESRGTACRVRSHQTGVRLWLWELLPDRRQPDPLLIFEPRSPGITAGGTDRDYR